MTRYFHRPHTQQPERRVYFRHVAGSIYSEVYSDNYGEWRRAAINLSKGPTTRYTEIKYLELPEYVKIRKPRGRKE